MRDRMVEICEREFDRMAQEAVEERRRQRLAAKYPPKPDMVREVAKLLAAQWHQENAPGWACPLPVEMECCEAMICSDYNEQRLVGYFGRSVLWNGYNYELHPTFDPFCCGVMACPLAPPELRMDRELLRMFPPKPLAGFTTPLQWRRPDR